MGEVIQFQSRSQLEWTGIESDLRRAYSDPPELARAFERALPRIRAHGQLLYPEFSVAFQIPALPESEAQQVLKVVDAAFEQVHANLRKERATAFALIVALEVRVEFLSAQQS